MTPSTVAPPVAAPKMECWYEVPIGEWKEIAAVGHGTRIFTSTDPLWETFALQKKPVTGRFVVGSVKREGDEFIDKSLKIHSLQHENWERALELMKMFETKGTIQETPLADQVREIEQARERGQRDLVESLTKTIQTLASGQARPASMVAAEKRL